MANEFKHKDAGPQLTRTEDNAVDRHEADSQTTNDMLYFNGTSWIRATPSQIKALLDLEIGTDVLAQQTIGISDNNLVEVDGPGAGAPANGEYAKFTANGLEGRSKAEQLSDLNVEDGAAADQVASEVEVEELGTATYDDVQDYMNFFGDRTLLSGGGITDNGNGTATVAAGTAWAKVTDSDTAIGKFFDFSAFNSVAITDLLTNFIYLDYNGGTPQIVVTTASITTHGFKQDHIHIATIFRDGTTLHFHEESTIGVERVNRVDMRLLELHDADRASGLVTSDAGSLALSVTAGVIYEGLSRHVTTLNGSTWSTWYYDGDLGTPAWVEVTGQSTIDNANYNDVATGLSALTNNKYAVHWAYSDIDGENLFIVYGQGDYTINQAEEAEVPASLPDIAIHYGVLIAKIIVQEGQTSLEILYPWTTTFHSSLATDHGSLAGLTDDDHTQYTKHSLATVLNDFLVASGSGTFVKKNLAETIIILAHASAHQDGGVDEISVTALSGLLADDQHIIDAEAVSAVEAAGLTFAENKGIILDAVLSGDEKYSGITEIGTMGYGATEGDLMYLAVADTKWELAKGDVAATSKGKLGLCTVTTSEDSTSQVLLYGKMRSAAFPVLTVGAPVHVSAATAGDMAVAAPTGTTDFVVRIIGYGNTAEDLFFCPDNSYVELA